MNLLKYYCLVSYCCVAALHVLFYYYFLSSYYVQSGCNGHVFDGVCLGNHVTNLAAINAEYRQTLSFFGKDCYLARASKHVA